MTAKRRAIGYVRVSTAEQAVEGNGLDMQRKAIRDHCKRQGLQLVATLADEGQSGSNGLEHRLALAEALARLKAGEASVLVVYRLDRLARAPVLQETLVEQLRAQGTPVQSATEPDLDGDTDDPTRVLIRQIVGSIGQYEKAVIRGRMMAGKAAKAAKGGYTGGQPRYGKRAEERALVTNDAERQLVQFVCDQRAAGQSYRSICTALEAAGLRPRRAERWQPAVVRSIAVRARCA